MARIIRTKAGKVLLFDYMRLPILAYASHFAVFSAIPPRLTGEGSWRIWLKTERMPQRAARAQERAAAAVDAGDPQEARTSAGFQFRTRTPGKRPQPS